jgi:2-deoxy-D-gluconate 3-dehydrogenase
MNLQPTREDRVKSLFDLSGKVAIVTGGNGGIGLGMARGLAHGRASIVLVGRNSAKGKAAVTELASLGARAHFVGADLTDPAACSALVADTVGAHGRLDILINNAGTSVRKRPEQYALEEWHRLIDINLTSAFLCSQAAYAPMKTGGGGKMINIGSMMSIFGASHVAVYGATKGGIVQLTRSLAAAWAADNIQVNAVLPGWIDTELTQGARRDIPGLNERVLARTPAGRWGVPDDLAGIALFLSAPASDFVTGTAIPIDGGYSIQG